MEKEKGRHTSRLIFLKNKIHGHPEIILNQEVKIKISVFLSELIDDHWNDDDTDDDYDFRYNNINRKSI